MSEIIDIPPCNNPKVPQTTHRFRVATPLQMRFNDIDLLGHLNNSVYFQFLDLGKIEYFKTVLPSEFSLDSIYVVVVNVNCNFYSPAFMNEELLLLTAVTHLSRRSMKMEQRIVNVHTGDVKCVAETILAGFDPRTSRGMELDDMWADEIAKFENISRNL